MKIKWLMFVAVIAVLASCNGKKKKLEAQQARYQSSIDSIEKRSRIIEDSSAALDEEQKNQENQFDNKVAMLEAQNKSIEEIHDMKKKGLDTSMYFAKKKALLSEENYKIVTRESNFKKKIDSLEAEKSK